MVGTLPQLHMVPSPGTAPHLCRKILLWVAIVGSGLGLTQLMLVTGFNRTLGLSDELFALADTALLTALGQVAYMPILVLAARICPQARPGGAGTGVGEGRPPRGLCRPCARDGNLAFEAPAGCSCASQPRVRQCAVIGEGFTPFVAPL